MDFVAKAKRVFEIELAEAARVAERLDDSFVQAVQVIQKTVEARNKVVIVGVGKSGHIGEKIAATLTSTGTPAVVLNSLNALHGDLGVVSDGDCIIALSYSGETEELLRILPALSRFDVRIIAITGNEKSFLAQHADIHLDVRIQNEACPLGLAPTSSTTAMLILGDALAMVLLEARGFRKEDFARFHPGGQLGRSLLLKVEDIMRKRDQMAILPAGAKVREALREMARRRTGATIVIDEAGKLAGIFTHGDFGRYFECIPDLLEREVSEFMTPKPISVGHDKLAAEVLRLLGDNRIDDIVVVDPENVPVGLVDTQDLTKFRLV